VRRHVEHERGMKRKRVKLTRRQILERRQNGMQRQRSVEQGYVHSRSLAVAMIHPVACPSRVVGVVVLEPAGSIESAV